MMAKSGVPRKREQDDEPRGDTPLNADEGDDDARRARADARGLRRDRLCLGVRAHAATSLAAASSRSSACVGVLLDVRGLGVDVDAPRQNEQDAEQELDAR